MFFRFCARPRYLPRMLSQRARAKAAAKAKHLRQRQGQVAERIAPAMKKNILI
jgi:hypothetical protein